MPEQQTFTAQQKLNALHWAGVSPVLMPGDGLSHSAYSRGLCSCCGVIDITIHLSDYGTKERLIAEFKRKMYATKTAPNMDIATPLLSCAVVIPDTIGNLLIEWDDK